jgi:hypothetical protein
MTLGDDLGSRLLAALVLASGRVCACWPPSNACFVHRSGLRRDWRHGPLTGSPHRPLTGGI